MKVLKDSKELIKHMKDKGIQFNKISERDAKDFLENNNYYLKLASYRGNYTKRSEGKNKGKYINLEFAYLKELSIIDMHLRYIIIEMCLDIEHALKVKLLKEITKNKDEDGYLLIRKFLAEGNNIKILENIYKHRNGEYCKDLIKKYYPYFPIWVFLEVISFGELLNLCSFYQELYNNAYIIDNKLMNEVRDIRNAAAHSNCLINKLGEKIDKTKQPDSKITNFIKDMNCVGADARSKYLRRRFSYSFMTLLFVYDEFMPEKPKKKRYEQIKNFMENRVVRNKDYFEKNSLIVSTYNFHKKVIDKLIEL